METSWHSYPKVYALGHASIGELLLDPVVIEEKIDGSQLSFGRFGNTLRMRSRGQEINVDAPDSLFKRAVEVVRELAPELRDGWTYRAEYLAKPKHNALAYDRIPEKHLLIFDINDGFETYLEHATKAAWARGLGLETAPLLYEGVVTDPNLIRELLDRTSVLGGQKIEGVVVKNYRRFGLDKKVLMGKYVSEAFKEVHRSAWKQANPNGGDVVDRLVDAYRTSARWQKAVQHIRERGELFGEPKDIGALIREVNQDTIAECGDEIRAALWKWAWPKLSRRITAGLAEWYKAQLLAEQPVPPEAT